MANRIKEDEKNEKIIRGLLKLPQNRRCINCNSLGPQYVCTNFWTFICTNCGGLHREFTHRVKSISMAKFTSQEVNALQGGGNERAREIYFKEWDPQHHSLPDSSNLDRLRDFIKHVYVDRKYSGERSINRPPRGKGESGDREDYSESRPADSYRGGSRSPPYDDHEGKYSERPGSSGRNDERKVRFGYEERGLGYDQDGYRSPNRFEMIDEKRRDDKPRYGDQNRKFEDRRSPDGVPRPEGRSPNHQKHVDALSPPIVHAVRDIAGGDIPPLRVGEPPKSNGIRASDSSTQAQNTVSSNSRGSSDGNGMELKKANFESLIDFSADPQPPIAGAPHQSSPEQNASPPSDGGGWASFDVPAQQRAPEMASNLGDLESALGQLSAPGSSPAVSFSTLPITGDISLPKSNNGGQWLNLQQHQQFSLFQPAHSQSTNQPLNAPTVGVLNNQAATRLPHETSAGGFLQPGGRKELPEDLFTAIYSSPSASVSGWQTRQHAGMGYGLQYPAAMTMPMVTQSSNPRNPFDLANESTLRHAHTFPSMTSLQGALPNMNNPSALPHSSSFGAPPGWMPPQQPSYPSSASTSPYMVQQQPSNMPQQVPNNLIPTLHQGVGGFGGDRVTFGSSAIDQHAAMRNSQMGTPNSFVPSVGGNPFG